MILAAELTAAVDGLSFCLENNFDGVRIFSDSVDAVQAIKGMTSFMGVEEFLVDHLQTLLKISQ